MRAAAPLSPKEGVEMIKKINAAKREPAPTGVKLDDLVDLQTLRPKQVYVDHYRKFTKIFTELGLDYPTWGH